jgi:enoyl-CoA hydratase/carnithine racemase
MIGPVVKEARMTEVVTTREGAVQRVQLNRPDKKNAITTAMYAALADAITAADADPAVRVLLLHGAGDCFTAGNDLADFLANPPQSEDRPAFRFLHAISHAAKPIVAAVHGVAIGIGTTMLGHCDLVYAAEGTRFHLPFVNLGLCPEGASSLLLPLVAGYQRAAELLMLGEPFDAARARAAGLVNEIVPGTQLLAAAAAAAQKLAAKPPASLRLTKRLLKRALLPQIEAALAAELEVFVERLDSPEAKEAFTAFLEKRPPDFSKYG